MDVEGKAGKSLGLRYEEEEVKARVAPAYLGTAQKYSANDIIIDALLNRRHREGSCWLLFLVLPLWHSSDTNNTRSPTAIVILAEAATPPLLVGLPSVFEATTT